ncbi:MAG: hydrolase TatD [Halobacteriovoraceae bacterium]|nr:hydrolase TatD [Halobacteriovoraceae bacterium]|tara:strand:- start:13555 stop:14325 length:771 start_codon:yes stop_codon:yes gene_type:complete
MNKIIETHCHLDYLKSEPLEDILSKSKEAGVEKLVTIAVEPDNFDAAYELAKSHEQVYFTQGIHPHDARLATEEAFAKIKDRSSEEKMVAVGEIGLDYHYDNSPRDIQRDVFRRQMEIAIELDRPVVIHSRDADEDMILMLRELAPRLKKKGVIHSFTSSLELAKTALELGFYLGFNGIITFKKAQDVREAVKLAPLDRILTETDSPFLTPVPHRGKENAPYRLPHIVEKIAEIKELDVDKVYGQTYENAQRLFAI